MRQGQSGLLRQSTNGFPGPSRLQVPDFLTSVALATRNRSKAVAIAEKPEQARRARAQNSASHRSEPTLSHLPVPWAHSCYSSPTGAPAPRAASPVKSTPLGLQAPVSKEGQGTSLLVQK